VSDVIAELDARLMTQVRGANVGALARLVNLAREAKQKAADAQRALADERLLRSLDEKEAQRRLDQAAASLGARVAEVARLERELVILRARDVKTVVCSGCDLEVAVRSLNWGTRRTHPSGSGLCGGWLKDGQPWELDCEHPADAAEAAGETT